MGEKVVGEPITAYDNWRDQNSGEVQAYRGRQQRGAHGGSGHQEEDPRK